MNKYSLTVLHENQQVHSRPTSGPHSVLWTGSSLLSASGFAGGSLGTSLASFPCRSRHTWFIHVLLTTRSQQTRQRLDSESDGTIFKQKEQRLKHTDPAWSQRRAWVKAGCILLQNRSSLCSGLFGFSFKTD